MFPQPVPRRERIQGALRSAWRNAVYIMESGWQALTARRPRLLAAYACWGAGLYFTSRLSEDFPDPEDSHAIARLACRNGGLALAYYLLHPGTVGDPQVPEEDQHSMLWGMSRAVVDDYALQRFISVLFLTHFWQQSALNSSGFWRPLIRWGASGMSMLPYAATVASKYARLFRANPLLLDTAQREEDHLRAGLLNFVTHCVNTSAALFININVTYALRAVTGDPVAGTPLLNSMVPSAAGVATNHICLSILVNYAGGRHDHEVTRVVTAGFARLATRLGLRTALVGWNSPTEAVFTVLIEIAEAATMHRWFVERAANFRDGLRMGREHASLIVGARHNLPLLPPLPVPRLPALLHTRPGNVVRFHLPPQPSPTLTRLARQARVSVPIIHTPRQPATPGLGRSAHEAKTGPAYPPALHDVHAGEMLYLSNTLTLVVGGGQIGARL